MCVFPFSEEVVEFRVLLLIHVLSVCSFLVIANGIAAAYSFFQVLRCVVSLVRGSVLFNKPLAWAIFSGDQVLRFTLFFLHLFYCCAFI